MGVQPSYPSSVTGKLRHKTGGFRFWGGVFFGGVGSCHLDSPSNNLLKESLAQSQYEDEADK